MLLTIKAVKSVSSYVLRSGYSVILPTGLRTSFYSYFRALPFQKDFMSLKSTDALDDVSLFTVVSHLLSERVANEQ